MKNYIIYSLSACLLMSAPALAQDASNGQQSADIAVLKAGKQVPTRVVKGVVFNGATRQPMSGVLVSAAALDGYSTFTEPDGTYTLNIPLSVSQLYISAPNMNGILVGVVEGEQVKNSYLYPETFADEYIERNNMLGIQAVRDFDYSDAVSIEEEIQKQAGAAVHTISRSGTAGIGSVMFMNGLNSLNVNAQPLIVIDGVIVDQQYNRQMLHQGFYNNILSNINPNDIEKVTVLRNGTSLYGAKGANGVILIDTRRNKTMATRITASVSSGITLEPKFIDMMDATQYKSYASDLLSTTNTTIKDFKFLNENPSYYYYPQYHNNTDWKQYVYRTGISQNYNINVSGGDDVANYNLSLGYVDKQSTLVGNDMDRINIRFNTDIEFTDKFDARFDISFAKLSRNLRNDGATLDYSEGTSTAPGFLAYVKSPMLSPYTYSDGVLSNSFIDVNDESYLDEALSKYNNYNYKLANPIAVNDYGNAQNKNFYENSMLNISVTPKYQFNDHLALSEHFSYNLVNTSENYYIPMNGVPSYFVASVSAYRDNETRALASHQGSMFSDTRLDWSNRYGAHDWHVFGGARVQMESYSLNTQVGYNTGNDKTPFMSSSLLNANNGGSDDKWNSWAWYAQGEYNYLQRYYLQLNATAETSSRFGKDAINSIKAFGAPWTMFYGAQGAWVVSNESWMAGVEPIDYLRISAGYDVSGNDDIDYYAARSYFRAFKFMNSISGIAFDNIGNSELQAEITRRFNVGLETNLLKNRLSLRLNGFISNTDNLLTFQSLGFLSGLEYNWSNGGALSNRGFDASVVGKLIATKNFQWEVGASAGHYKNEITRLADNKTVMDTQLYGATIRTEVGQAANLFYGYETEGVFATSEQAAESGLYILAE
ncbi:MAG: TonB-dependent receptor plug domain-containing protein, partial [Bacteroidaceae bacterium]|nr:TonB-dependent receptor plug domain-containing protein [Bacteroidaceae bacterium]